MSKIVGFLQNNWYKFIVYNTEAEYNPSKLKYHPINDACWLAGAEVPYLALARTLELIEATSGRLKIVEILSNYLRSVIALTPEDLLPSVYMCLNQLAPAYESLELGESTQFLADSQDINWVTYGKLSVSCCTMFT